MLKSKTCKIAIVAVASILALVGGFFLGRHIYRQYRVDFGFGMHDTVPEGNGKKARVILLGGQSNAAGCSSVEYLEKNVSPEKFAEYQNGYENVYINYYVTGTNESREFVKCVVGQGEAGGYFGPELGLAEKLHEMYPDELFFIVKCTWSGTDLYSQWLSPSSEGKTGDLYRGFMNFALMNVKYLKSKGYDVSIEGMCWMQGESDSFFVETATGYEENLNNFIGDIREKLSRYAAEDGIALIDAYIADNPAYWVYCDLVNASKQAVADASPLNVVIDTNAEGLTCANEPAETPDMAHYDSMSEIKLGHLFAAELAKFFD